jgi:hypothetical protein
MPRTRNPYPPEFREQIVALARTGRGIEDLARIGSAPMTERTTRKTVTFCNPFSLGADPEVFPAGHYVVETDEELLEPLSFTAYRRVATIMNIPPRAGVSRALTIDLDDLDAALSHDHEPAKTGVVQSDQSSQSK